MSKNICITQNKYELESIWRSIEEEFYCIPLNLETHIFCLNNEIGIIDFLDILKPDFQEVLLTNYQEFTTTFDYKVSNSLSINIEAFSAFRYLFNSATLVLAILKEFQQKWGIGKIYVSGWQFFGIGIFSEQNYFISEIAASFAAKYNIDLIELSPKKLPYEQRKIYIFQAEKLQLRKKSILLNSIGYNFHRVALMSFLNNFSTFSFVFSRVRILKRIKYFLIRHDLVFIKKTDIEAFKLLSAKDIINPIFIAGIDLTQIFKVKNLQVTDHVNELEQKKAAVQAFMKTNKPCFVFSYSTRGFDGLLLEIGSQIGTPTMSISHGTVTESFNNFDNIYKQIIADAVFSGESTYHALQSKIAKKSTKTIITRSTSIETGNLIFSGSVSRKKKQYFLYCVTLKDFYNIQFYGVEFFNEFLDNLKKLNTIAGEVEYPIVVKLHPSQLKLSNDLVILFRNLSFETRSIKRLLKQAAALISFSSTAIEDALSSTVPVILFDPFSRYKHCDAELDPSKENEPVYYVNSESSLVTVLNTVTKNTSTNFSKFVYNLNYYANIYKLFDLLNLSNKLMKPILKSIFFWFNVFKKIS